MLDRKQVERSKIPPEVYKNTIAEDGVVPSDVLRLLESYGWITFTQHSITYEQFISSVASEMKELLDSDTLLGVGLSIAQSSDDPHFITIKGPMVDHRKKIQTFDSLRSNPIYFSEFNDLWIEAAKSSLYGRHNVWYINKKDI